MNNENVFVCIMAGGSGERFWPLSRKSKPKHLLKLFSEKTLLEETVRRVEGVVPLANILVLTNQSQLEGAREALCFLPPDQILAEPAKRDTAPAAALATAWAQDKTPEAIVALLPADARIRDVELFREQFDSGIQEAKTTGAIVTFSILPQTPATGFGYLKLGLEKSPGIYQVERFVEKPTLEKAQEYLASKSYGWNSGIFIWRVSTFIEEAQRQVPALASFIINFPKREAQQNYLQEVFEKLPKISVDYAIMEQAKLVYAVKAEFDWDDVGTWTALPAHLGQDKDGNTSTGALYGYQSTGNIVVANDKAVALCGVSNLVIIETSDSILVCHRDKVQEVKKMIELLPDSLT